MLGGVTTLLYGMIGMIGIRIWVENKVNFDKPVNIMVAAITMIIAIGQFAFTIGGTSFNGIAIVIVSDRILGNHTHAPEFLSLRVSQ